MLKNDLLLRAARRERTERTPVWLMRQAGRYDPEYQAVRQRCGLALEEMFRRPDLAATISLLPRRLGVDAIIVFQDILIPLAPMGAPFVFRPGPILESPLRTSGDVRALMGRDPVGELGFVRETLQFVRNALGDELPLLGFAGAPFTLACFLIEGGSPGASPRYVRAMMRAEPALLHGLLEALADMTADYLAMQIESGADAVQLFESSADVLSRTEYESFAHRYQARVFSKLAATVPTILFVKDFSDVGLMAESGADVLSIGAGVDLASAIERVGDRVALQGNLDNQLLVNGPIPRIEAAVRDCVRVGGSRGHILNLGHGLLKETPIEHVRCLIDTCKATRVAASADLVEAG